MPLVELDNLVKIDSLNNGEYEGSLAIDAQLVNDLLAAAEIAYSATDLLGPVKPAKS